MQTMRARRSAPGLGPWAEFVRGPAMPHDRIVSEIAMFHQLTLAGPTVILNTVYARGGECDGDSDLSYVGR